jgi:methyl-accepting chemotaxis protein
MNLSQFKVRTRLYIGFSLVFSVLAIVLFVGIYKLSSLDDVLTQNGDYGTQEISAIARSIGKAQGSVLSLQRLISSEDPARKAAEKKGIEEKLKVYVSEITNLNKLYSTDPAVSDSERQMLKRIDELSAAGIPLLEKTMQLGMGADAVATQQALRESNSGFQAWTDELGKLRDYIVQKNTHAAEKAHQDYRAARNFLLIVAALGLVLSGAMAALIAQSIQRQLGGEPGEAAEIASRIAAGDLQMKVQLRANDHSSLLYFIAQMRDQLSIIVGKIHAVTDSVSNASSEIAHGNADLSSRTEQQAGSLEETASAMEQLTSTVKQNADNAQRAKQLAESASAVAVEGGNVVGQVVQMMSSINDSSKKIVDIISVIDGIAFQTNILALNAAVEAARAGEQGRGFAVVATEVRGLAQRSAAAAKEIKVLINDSVGKVDSGGKLVEQAGTTIDQVVISVKKVTDIVAEMSSATQEQSAGLEEINRAIAQMDQVTQQNAALVEQAAAAAESLQEQAGNLSQTVSVFKVDASNWNQSITPIQTQPVNTQMMSLSTATPLALNR